MTALIYISIVLLVLMIAAPLYMMYRFFKQRAP